MAIDGLMLSLIKSSVLDLAKNARVDKIYQSSKDELVLGLRIPKESRMLYISVLASSARIHFTNEKPQNPNTPPMFCMLLRKHLMGGKLGAIRQLGMDRVLLFDFECRNEFGDPKINTLAIEIMGRHSNLILMGDDGAIIDSIKRVGFDLSSVRQVLPKLDYISPPGQDKIDLDEVTAIEAAERILMGKEQALAKAVGGELSGFSPLVSREIAYLATGDVSKSNKDLSESERKKLISALDMLKTILAGGEQKPMVLFKEDGGLFDFSFFDITQYGDKLKKRYFENIHDLHDFYFLEQMQYERVRARSGELVKKLHSLINRAEKKIANLKDELDSTERADENRIKGDLLTSNMHTLKKGLEEVELLNYYDESGGNISVKLNPLKTPVENAQHYYKIYRKAETAKKILALQIDKTKEERIYIESVLDTLLRSESEDEMAAVKEELTREGYIRRSKTKKGNSKNKDLFFKYSTSSGKSIMVGKNNISNDALTHKNAKKLDFWFHVKGVPGSHLILSAESGEPSEKDVLEAAMLAAYHSSLKGELHAPVDYTLVKNVRKTAGGKPGMVNYTGEKMILVDASEENFSLFLKNK